jgi:AbrB family looped-hinge helix DNA binding protein
MVGDVEEVTVSIKNQIVVPKGARKALKLKPGDRLRVVVVDDRVILHRPAKDPVAAFRGSARGLRYPAGYLDREREEW